MKEQIKAMVKAELIKEAGVLADIPVGGGGTRTVNVERFGFSEPSFDDDGTLYENEYRTNIPRLIGTLGSAGVLSSALVGLMSRNPNTVRIAKNVTAASAVPWLGGRAAEAIVRHNDPGYYDEPIRRVDSTQYARELGLSNFRNG